MNEQEFQFAVMRINAIWPRWPMLPDTQAEYRDGLCRFSSAEVNVMLDTLRETSERIPSLYAMVRPMKITRNTGPKSALPVAHVRALAEGPKREATPHQGVADLIGRLSKDKAADLRRKASDILSGKGAE